MNDWEIEDGKYGKKLTLHVDWTDNLIPILKREHVQELQLIKADNFGWKSLDFLANVPWLKSFALVDLLTQNIAGVHFLSELQSIYMGDYSTQPIDFSRFPLLKACRMEFKKNRASIFSCRDLEMLSLQHYPYPDLTPVMPLAKLKRLYIAQGSLADISGIGAFSNLTDLSLILLRNVKDLHPLAQMTGIEKLSLESSKGFLNLCALSGLISLRQLNISRCGQIESLSPLMGCKNLELLDFSYDTVIADGDLKILLDMPKLKCIRMANRRHYNLKREEIPAFYGKYFRW